MEQLLKKNPRIEVVDALRGFAVMAIILVHNLEHFIFPVYPTDSPSWLNTLDQGVFNAVFSLFAGKAYAIFALLFGLTFYIQSNNQRKQGKDFGYRFLWRLVLLTGFATLNAAFFPAGDVLLLFVVVGLVLFLASVGIKAGAGFWDTVVQGDGLKYVYTGFLITVIPILVVGTFARLKYKINYFTIMGMIAGTYTDPPALAYANASCSKEAPAVGYSTVYPLCMFLRILTAQLIILLCCA